MLTVQIAEKDGPRDWVEVEGEVQLVWHGVVEPLGRLRYGKAISEPQKPVALIDTRAKKRGLSVGDTFAER
jgi:hypothetical protein